jgi:hypothetical protein
MENGKPDSPRAAAAAVEAAPLLPGGANERFHGYGVTGVAFASGHVLALRRFPASSIGPAYSAVWLRSPLGPWTFYADVEPELACGRYFGSAGSVAARSEIIVSWLGDASFTVRVRAARLAWAVHLRSTPATRLLSAVARLPAVLRHGPRIRTALAATAGRVLGVGHLVFDGRAPQGQRFSIDPQRVWAVDASSARLQNQHLGPLVLPQGQNRLGDLWIPRWGMFTIGHETFEAAPDPFAGAPGGREGPAGGATDDSPGRRTPRLA